MSKRPSPTRRPRRLLAPAPSVAAVLVLLVGSVLPVAPSQSADGLRGTTAATAEPAPTDEPPASVTEVPEPAPSPPKPLAGNAVSRQTALPSNPWSVPDVLLAAYRQAAAGAPPACHLPVNLLAAIGQVESGSLAGRSLDNAHRAVPPVLGPVLDGGDTAAIRDTDGGRLDGDSRWDRAVGPMQFIPGSWAAFGVDGDGDGRADPQNVYDATAAAAKYLCAGGRDLALASDLRSAILAYNHSTAYLATVLTWQQRFSGSSNGTIQTVIGTIQGVNDMSTPKQLPAAASAASRTVQLTPIVKVTVRAAAKLAFTRPPSPTATSDTGWARQPLVTIQDAAGNTVTTDTRPLALTLTNPDGTTPDDATLTCDTNTTTAVAGIARFTGCAIDKAGTYTLTATDGSLTSTTNGSMATSATITITAGVPAKLAFTTTPGPTAVSDTGWTRQPVVTIQDTAGNTVTTDTSPVTLTLTTPDAATPDGATLTCDANPTTAVAGIARFTGCVVDKAGAYTLAATNGSLTSTTSSDISITAGAAAKLAFTTTPGPTAVSETGWARQPVVTIQDAAGNTVTTDTSAVTLAMTNTDGTPHGATTGGATLTCDANPATAVAGIARFTGCAMDKAGTYTLSATNASFTSATNGSLATITITAGAAAKLAFTTTPSPTATSDTGWTNQPVVTIQDAAGNTVTTDTSPVTLTLTTPDGATPNGATLTCDTNPATAVAGIARFTGCAIDKAGAYTLNATNGSPATSAIITITITAASTV